MTATTQNGHTPTTAAAPGFASLVRQYRERVGMSQNRLNAKLEESQGYISRIESGNRNPSRRLVCDIAAALDLSRADEARLLCKAGFLPTGVSVEDVVALVERQAA